MRLNPEVAIGTVVKQESYWGTHIEKVVIWVAYARNGNVHNPTVYYGWQVRDLYTEQVVSGTLKTKAQALNFAKEYLEEINENS